MKCADCFWWKRQSRGGEGVCLRKDAPIYLRADADQAGECAGFRDDVQPFTVCDDCDLKATLDRIEKLVEHLPMLELSIGVMCAPKTQREREVLAGEWVTTFGFKLERHDDLGVCYENPCDVEPNSTRFASWANVVRQMAMGNNANQKESAS